MIEIIEVKSNMEQREFVNFPLSLYKDCSYYVPELKLQEFFVFKNNNPDIRSAFFLAKQNGITVGRIGGIIHNLYNEKSDQRRVRFTRFDCINNYEVAQALFNSVEKWAMDNNMNCVHGPMGFNDLEKIGVQVSDFNKEGNIITQYNFPYYKQLIERCGYKPEATFAECKLFSSDGFKIKLSSDEYSNVKIKNRNIIIKKYKAQIFDLINECYIPLYGSVPITPILKEKLLKTFKFLINLDLISVVVDKDDKVVGFGVAIPGIAKELSKSKGRLISMQAFKMARAFKKPNYAEVFMLCVSPEHKNKGVEDLIASKLVVGFKKYKIKRVNTNPIIDKHNQEYILSKFEHITHKKRVAYSKLLNKD